MSGQPHPADLCRMELPRRGDLLFYLLALPFFLVTLGLSIWNLTRFRALSLGTLIASGIWLALVLLMLMTQIRVERGFKQYLVNRLGSCSRSQFVSVIEQHDGSKTVRFGYDLFGREWSYAEIPARAISSLGWSPGQASALSQREMADWSVWLRYRGSVGESAVAGSGSPTDNWYHVGSGSGEKRRTEAFGLSLVEFLKSAGICLQRGEKEHEFVPVPSDRTGHGD
jgi:hypothetical protein